MTAADFDPLDPATYRRDDGALIVPFEKVAEAPTTREVIRATRNAFAEAREVNEILADQRHVEKTVVVVKVIRVYAPGKAQS